MANIPIYEQRVGIATPNLSAPNLGRRASAEDFNNNDLQALGQVLQGVGQTVTAVDEKIKRRQEQAEVSDLTAKVAKARGDLTIKLRDMLNSADPNDPELTNKALKEFDDYLGNIGSNISTEGGRQYFNQASATLRSDYYVRAAEGQANLAGAKAKNDYQTSLNAYTSSVIDDPSALGSTLDLHRQAIQALVASGAISRIDGEQLERTGREDIAKAGALGLIDANPEAALKTIRSGMFDADITGLTKEQLIGQAEQGMRAKQAELEHRQVLAEKAKREAQDQLKNQLFTKIYEGGINANDIVGADLDVGDKENLIAVLKAKNKEDQGYGKPLSNPLFNDLFYRIHLPAADPNAISDENYLYNRQIIDNLSNEDFSRLRTEIQGRRTTEGQLEGNLKKTLFDLAKAQISKSTQFTIDQNGDANFANYQAFVYKALDRAKKNGTDPLTLLDPDNKENYLGLPKYLNAYKADDILSRAQEQKAPVQPAGPGIIENLINKVTGKENAPENKEITRLPGESVDDFLARKKAAGQ